MRSDCSASYWYLIQWAGRVAGSSGHGGASRIATRFPVARYSVEVKATSRSGPGRPHHPAARAAGGRQTGDSISTACVRPRRRRRSGAALSAWPQRHEAAIPTVRMHADEAWAAQEFSHTPAGRDQSAVPYRVIEEALYRVAGGFPRLTRSSFPDGLPAGVSRVSYQLDMTACRDWLVGRSPDSWPPRHDPKSL